MKSKTHFRSSKTPTFITHYEEDSKLVDNFYQPSPPPPRRPRRDNVPSELREHRVYLPHFIGK